MQKKALGKGLEALLPTQHQVSGGSAQNLQEIPLTQILVSPFQPRKDFLESDLNQLAQSVKANGILQPILVRKTGDGAYQLIAGERRFRAAKLAKLSSIPSIVKNASDPQSMYFALIENIQRQNLNPMEEARAYARLNKEFGLTQEKVAEQVGKDRSTVANLLRLLTLPKAVQEMVEVGGLTLGHAKVILGIQNSVAQVDLAKRIVSGGMSVRQAEKLSSKKTSQPSKTRNGKGDLPLRHLESQLREKLATKVVINNAGKGGSIAISYYSAEDLNRIVEVILR